MLRGISSLACSQVRHSRLCRLTGQHGETLCPKIGRGDVDSEEYRQQIDVVASLTLEMASHDVERLEGLMGKLNSLPPDVLDEVMDQLFPADLAAFPEEQRIEFWHKLTDFIRMQKREQAQFPESRVPLDDEQLARVENFASRLAHKIPLTYIGGCLAIKVCSILRRKVTGRKNER